MTDDEFNREVLEEMFHLLNKDMVKTFTDRGLHDYIYTMMPIVKEQLAE